MKKGSGGVRSLHQRGMGTIGIIVAMVIAGLIVYGVIYYGPGIWRRIQETTKGTPGGAPLYPNSGPKIFAGVEIEALPELLPPKWSGKLYETIGEENEIADWYRLKMSELGWIKEHDNQVGRIAYDNQVFSINPRTILGFTNGEDAIVFVIRRDSYWIFAGPKARLSDILNQVGIAGLW